MLRDPLKRAAYEQAAESRGSSVFIQAMGDYEIFEAQFIKRLKS